MGKASGERFARRCAPGYHINGQGAETATPRIIIMTCMESRRAHSRGSKGDFQASQNANRYYTCESRWFGKVKAALEHAQALNL